MAHATTRTARSTSWSSWATAAATTRSSGGFSDVRGLGTRSSTPSTATGTTRRTTSARSPTPTRTDDVTLKRGVIGDLRLFEWLKATREGDFRPQTVTDHAARRGAAPRSASGSCPRRSRRSGSARRWPPRAAARSRWRSCTWSPSGSTSSRYDRCGLQLGRPGIYPASRPGPAPLRAERLDIAGFVGVAPRGPLDDPVPVESWSDYQWRFGGLDGPGLLAPAVSAFFAQGGRRAVVLRVSPRPAGPAAGHRPPGPGPSTR